MAQAWKVVVGGDLWKVVSRSVVAKADEDAQGGTTGTNDIDQNLDTRAKEAVRMAVEEVRGAVELGNRYPLSVTAGSVPPEAERHTLYLAAYTLLAFPPSLLQVLVFDGGVYSPLQKCFDDAKKWLEGIRGGKLVATMPTDPVAGWTPAIRWGDSNGDSTSETAGKIDVSTDGPWNTSETA